MRIFVKPVKRIHPGHQDFDLVKSAFEIGSQADPNFKRSVRVTDKEAIVTGRVDRDNHTVRSPLDFPVKAPWQVAIDILGEGSAVVYTRDGEIAKPYFDGTVKNKDGGVTRKRAFRLPLGCQVAYVDDEGFLILQKPRTWREEAEGVQKWVAGYSYIHADDLRQFFPELKPFSSGSGDEQETEEHEQSRTDSSETERRKDASATSRSDDLRTDPKPPTEKVSLDTWMARQGLGDASTP